MSVLELSSPVFENGGSIPEKYGYVKKNVNPPLEITGVPESADSLVLVMDDPDAMEPAGKVWDHWVLWNLSPDIKEIKEGEIPDGVTEGTTDYGERGYGGPNPPDKEHTYRFRLFAVEGKVNLDPSSKKGELLKEIEGRVVEETGLNGKYKPVK